MNNNPFYVLSMEYKKNEKKKRESFVIPKAPCCVRCKFDPVSFLHGHYKGWCKSCKEMNESFSEWQEACWDEDCKPESERNHAVYRGQFKRKK